MLVLCLGFGSNCVKNQEAKSQSSDISHMAWQITLQFSENIRIGLGQVQGYIKNTQKAM